MDILEHDAPGAVDAPTAHTAAHLDGVVRTGGAYARIRRSSRRSPPRRRRSR